MVNLALVEASWDRVTRTTVGLRPHRPSGFVLQAEKLDAKTVIHNYGHGGAGLSLSLGTGALAADIALQHQDRTAAVLGSGAVGLGTARQLQRRGFDVTIYTMALPPDTTSNKAWGGFTPTSGLLSDDPTPEWTAQFRKSAESSYRQLQLMAGRRRYGVSWVDAYNTLEDLPTEADQGEFGDAALLAPELRTGRDILYPGEHPFPTPYATRRPTIRIEPSIYLDAMLAEFRQFGGGIVIRKFDDPRDLTTLEESIIVNCTGLGARELFGDEELVPVKGQLTFLVPQPEVTYRYGCMPRSDGIALGSTRERGVWSLDVDEGARRRAVERAIERFSAMHRPDPRLPLAASRAPAPAPSVTSFFGDRS